jgi:hypothetical protein
MDGILVPAHLGEEGDVGLADDARSLRARADRR